MLWPRVGVALCCTSVISATAMAANDYLDEKTFADKKELVAKATKSCIVRQRHSAFKAQNFMKAVDMTNPYMRVALVDATISIIQVNVLSTGGAQISIRGDAYPGTAAYFLLDGKRYTGSGSHWLSLDAHAMTALKADKKINAVWTKWPYRNEINESDVLAGFTSSFEECLIYIRKK